MYVKTTVTLQDATGNEDEYEVGADVEPEYDNYGGKERQCGYVVSEPDVSAPGCNLRDSRIAQDPQDGGLCDGWSERVEEALIDVYCAHHEADSYDEREAVRADYLYDTYREEY